MPGPVVAVAVEGPEQPALTRALLSSCGEVAGPGGCAPLEGGQAHSSGTHASIRWDDDQLTAWVRVTRLDGELVVRRVSFDETDPVEERWRSVGLIVGVIAEELPRGAPGGVPDAVEEGKDVAEAEDDTPAGTEATAAAFWVEPTMIFGPAVERGNARLGAELRGAYRLEAVPVVFLGAGGYAVSSQERDVSLSFATVSAGVAVVQSVAGMAQLRLRLEALLQNTRASAPSGISGREESADAVDYGIALGLDGIYPADGWISVVVGGSMLAMAHDTVVRLDGRDLGRLPEVGWELQGGLRIVLARR